MADILYTRSEKARRAKLLLKGAKNSAGDVSEIEHELDRIDDVAAERTHRERAAWERQLDQARDTLATAKVAERAATREGKPGAKRARQDAEKRLKAVERTRI